MRHRHDDPLRTQHLPVFTVQSVQKIIWQELLTTRYVRFFIHTLCERTYVTVRIPDSGSLPVSGEPFFQVWTARSGDFR